MTSLRLSLLGSSLLLLGIASAQTGPVRFVPLKQDLPKRMLTAVPAGQKDLGDPLHITVSFNYGDPVGMQQFVDSVSDPKSPEFRHFITPEEIGRRFGPTAAQVKKVSDYLTSQGLNIRLVAKNRLGIVAEGSVAQVQNAFHTSIENFVVQPTGKQDDGKRFSFTTPPMLPANISGPVLDVSGLDSFTRPKPHGILTPTQIQTLYNVAPMYGKSEQGQNRTIAISNFDGFRVSNETEFVNYFSLPVPTAGAGSNITIIPVSGGNGQAASESGEGDLDIQCAVGVAPLCSLLIYDNGVTSGGNDPIGVYTQEANDNKADIITESYGWEFGSQTTNLAAHNIHLSMSAQGITYLVASGDTGTNNQGFTYPEMDPEVLLVGGTSVTVNSNNQRTSEVGWNDSSGQGGGGWVVSTDTFNVRPAYQSTTAFTSQAGVPSATSAPYRLSPDVALDADPATGYYLFMGTNAYEAGGTSAASPTTAASLALVEQQLIADGFLKANSSGKYRLGRINDTLYSYNNDSTVFFDVVSGTNGTLPNGATSNAVVGWDTDAGWGPINFAGLVTKIEGVSVGVASLSLNPSSVVGGAGSTGTVTLTAAAGTGGTAVSLSSSNSTVTVPSSVTVASGSKTATFSVTTQSVSTAQTVTITATQGSTKATATLTVNATSVSGITILSPTVVAGTSTTGTVTIANAAGSKGLTVYLTSSSIYINIPTSVTVASGATSASFTIKTYGIATSTTATISAGLSATSGAKKATITITPAALNGLTLSSASVVGGSTNSVTGTVTLNGVAPTGGYVVSLSSSSSAASVPASVTVPVGTSSAKFNVTTTALVTKATSATIKASVGSLSQSASLTVNPFLVNTLSLSSTSVVGGTSVTGTVTLNAAPSATAQTVALSSSSAVATVPSSVSVSAGGSTGTFTVKTTAVTASSTATIKGSLNGSSASASLTVNPPLLTLFKLSQASVQGSASTVVTGTVTISGPAPTGGFVVALSSSLTSAANVPASVTVAAGQTSVSFNVTHNKVSVSTPVTLKATKGSASTVTATLTVTP